MTIAVYVALCSGALICLAGCLWRVLLYARLPMHLRWELYPIPHEEPRRAAYGGSYFESTNWANSPQEMHRGPEWLAMLEEIFFLKSLREHNRRLWAPSLLFHSGLYLTVAAMALVTTATLLEQLPVRPATAEWVRAALLGSTWMGLSGAAMVVAGASLLLLRRATDRGMRNTTKPADYFNLLFFIATFALLAQGATARGPQSAAVAEVLRGLARFDRGTIVGKSLGTGLILLAMLIAYIPFTHMAHFIAKYFTWHAVRWDDRRNRRGSAIEQTAVGCLNYRPTWAAAHIDAGGKTWAEIAVTNPSQTGREVQR